MPIEIDCDPSHEDSQTLSDGIKRFNSDSVAGLEPVEDEKRFHVFARNDDGEVLGGLRGTCFWNTLHIELLWLSEELRGQGRGKMLLDSAEAYATENGCANALVETTSWQARPFYERNGYRHIATVNGRPRGHASHFLTKALTPK